MCIQCFEYMKNATLLGFQNVYVHKNGSPVDVEKLFL